MPRPTTDLTEPAGPTEGKESTPFTPEEAAAMDRAVLQDKQRGGYAQRESDRALRLQIQEAHRNKESWT